MLKSKMVLGMALLVGSSSLAFADGSTRCQIATQKKQSRFAKCNVRCERESAERESFNIEGCALACQGKLDDALGRLQVKGPCATLEDVRPAAVLATGISVVNQRPDLQATSLYGCAPIGGLYYYRISNTGGAGASGFYVIRSCSPYANVAPVFRYVSGLPAASSVYVTFPANCSLFGDSITVDGFNFVGESNEYNNTRPSIGTFPAGLGCTPVG